MTDVVADSSKVNGWGMYSLYILIIKIPRDHITNSNGLWIVYAYVTTLHPEAAQGVFKDANSKWVSSIETHTKEEAECDGEF